MGTHDDEIESSRSKRSRQHETIEEVLLPQVHHEFLLWEVNWDVLNRMGYDGEIDDMLRIRLHKVGYVRRYSLLLGLYQAGELDEEGFNVYFEGEDVWWMKRKGAGRELIESESRLIPEDLQPGVPRVGIPRPPIASV
nr:hypothetical protein [Tanacetum cinerariifolium]